MLMAEQFTLAEIGAFHRLKAAFDEHGLLNPGKGVPTLARCREYTLARVGGEQNTMNSMNSSRAVMDSLIENWTARISDAAGRGGKLAIRGGGSKTFTVDGNKASGSTLRPIEGSSLTNRLNWWSPRVPARRLSN
jgi:hypothetical protein